MKLIEIYESITESKNVGIVYHFTNLARAVKIIDTDLLKATYSTQRFPNLLTVSTTRDKNFVNTRLKNNKSGALNTEPHIGLIINGTLMSNKYQVKPYNDAQDEEDKINFGDEQEELWFGKNIRRDLGIKGITRFITGIILTKKLKRDLVNDSDVIFGGQYLKDKFDDSMLDISISPLKKLQTIKDFFEEKGFKVIIQ